MQVTSATQPTINQDFQRTNSRGSASAATGASVAIGKKPPEADPIRLPEARQEVEESREQEPIESRRFRRLLHKGLKRLARGVRNDLRELAREAGLDKETRQEIREAYRDFRRELRDAFRAAKQDESLDSEAFTATIRSSFRGLIEDVRAILAPDTEPAQTEPADAAEPTEATSNPEPQEPAQPLVERAVGFITTFSATYSRVEENGNRTTSFSFSYQSTRFSFEEPATGGQLEQVA